MTVRSEEMVGLAWRALSARTPGTQRARFGEVLARGCSVEDVAAFVATTDLPGSTNRRPRSPDMSMLMDLGGK